MNLRIASWSAARVAAAVGGTWRGGEAQVARVETDTRRDLSDGLFVALRGERFDGHDFLETARDAGASAALVESFDGAVGLPQLVVDDTLVALQRLGNAVFRDAVDNGVHTVSLTGSNGKTTTKEFLAALFRTIGPTHHTPGNFNNHIGVPLTLCAIPAEAEFVVIEMGANDFGDIRELTELAPAHQRVLVSIGAAHLEKLGDLDGVRRVKSEIFEFSGPSTVAVIPEAHRDGLLLEQFEGRQYLVGGPGCDMQFEVDHEGAVRLEWGGSTASLPNPYPGYHNASNLALAAATLVSGGFALDEAAAAEELRSLVLPGGRLRREKVGDVTFIDDAYNANPTSALASWGAFLEIAERELRVDEKHRVGVLGEMFELGEDAESMHAQTAEAMAVRGGASTFIWVGPFAEAMKRAASKHAGEHHAAETVEAAAKLIPSTGLVFLKASRGQRLEQIIDLVRSS